MEPMTLGSPVGSPASPTTSGTAASPFLPAYLMGESASTVTAGNNTTSPMKSHKQVSFNGCPSMSPPHMPHGSMDPRHLLPQANAEKSGGPPIKGLFETLDEAVTPAKSPKDDYSSFQEMNESMLTMPEPTRNSSADSWVTVFGFPVSAASFVAQQFAQCGTVVDKRTPTKGNWLHLCYQTSYEARKALSLNGKVFPGGIMVGVVPCRDEEVMNSTNYKENVCNRTNQSMNFSRNSNASQSIQVNNSFGRPSNRHNMSYVGTPVRHTSARPLGHTYRTAQVDSGVLRQGNIPQKSTSIVTKAMEYVFGW